MRCHRNGLLLLLLQLSWFSNIAWAQQRSAYSLQAAVDELHRREAAKYPLNAPPPRYLGSAAWNAAAAAATSGEQDYWDDDTEFPTHTMTRNRHRFNKALAKYLERDSYEADHGGLSLGPFGGYEFDDEEEQDDNNNNNPFTDEKKRASLFRERDNNKYENAPTSVFRERESQQQSPGGAEQQQHVELTEQFLREIEDASERERQERYKEALRHLWEKYQQQENEVDTGLFEEKKRMRMPPYYMLMQKKRSYPVLPWLPYSAEKKKRFPVAKRSTNPSVALGKTDEKVARELSELFGKPIEEKAKRSTDTQIKATATTPAPDTTLSALSDMRLEVPANHNNATLTEEHKVASQDVEDHQHMHAGYHGNSEKEHKHRKRSNHAHHSHEDSIEDSDEETEHEEHGEHEEEEPDSEDDEHEEFDEDAEERRKKKKKRDAAEKSLENLLNTRSKKSIDWSNYFGLDRKKKSIVNSNQEKHYNDNNLEEDLEEQKNKRELNPEKLESMDKKLQSIEDFIIDETIKYTGAHEGISNHDEIRRLKNHVLSRLATAYSLEKMRRALEKLRQSIENENHLGRNLIEPESEENGIEYLQNQKRLSVKKEKADLHENDSTTDEPMAKEHNRHVDNTENNEEDQENEVRKKKKRNGYLRYPELPNTMEDERLALATAPYESFNDAYLGNKNYIVGSNQCPLIESMAERCRGVDLLSGDLNQELLPICGVHQICYLCGTSQVACDYQYLAEADSICGISTDCQAAARSVLMILRGTPGPQLGPRECLKNPCLYSAMREIGL